jgi:hypothetical protein
VGRGRFRRRPAALASGLSSPEQLVGARVLNHLGERAGRVGREPAAQPRDLADVRRFPVEAVLVQVEPVRVGRVAGLAHDVGEEQLGRGDVAGPGPLDQRAGDGRDVVVRDRRDQGAAKAGGAAGERIARAAGVAPGEPAAGVAAVGPPRVGRAVW